MKGLAPRIFIVFLFTGCTYGIVNNIHDVAYDLRKSLDLKDEDYANSEIFLRLNTESHLGFIKDIAITNDKKFVVSAGTDSYVRIWDIKTGKLIDKISGYIGKDGSSGQIYSIALSNDNKYLVVGGSFVKSRKDGGSLFSEDGKSGFAIRLYDFKTKKLIKMLVEHNNIITKLKFSEDDKILLSSSADSHILVWDVSQDFKLINKFKEHAATVVDFDIKKINNDYRIASIDNGGNVYLSSFNYSSNSFKMINEFTPRGSPFLNIAMSNNHIVTSIVGNDGFVVFDKNLKFIKRVKFDVNKDHILYTPGANKVTFTPDYKYLIHGGTGLYVYDVEKGFKNIITNFDKDESFTTTGLAIEVIDSKNIIYAGSDLKVFDIEKNKITKIIGDKNIPILNVGLKGDKVAYGSKIYKKEENKYHPNDKGHLEKYFDLNLKNISSVKDESIFNRIVYKNNTYKLVSKKHGDILALYKNDNVISSLDYTYQGRSHNTYGFYKNYVVSAFNNINFRTFDLPLLDIKTQLVGHTSEILAIGIENDRLVSASSDNQIKIWNLSNVGKEAYILPLVSLYIAPNNEWVMWTPQGYFNSSENGYKYIGFHINQGFDKEAKWVGIEKLYDHFYRPDLVELALKGEDITPYTKGLSYKDVLKNPAPQVQITKVDNKNINTNEIIYKKDEINLEFNVNQIDNGGVGIIRIYQEGKLVKTIGDGEINRQTANALEDLESQKINQQAKQSQEEYLAKFDNSVTKSMNGTIEENELIDDVKVIETSNNSGVHKILLPLKSGINKIEIEAFNKSNSVASIREKLSVDAKIKKRESIVYAIIAGVDNFEDTKRFNNLKYSQNDAKSINEVLKTKVKEKVVSTLLLGENFTKEKLFKAINDIKSKAKLEDKIIFYVSTHGKAFKGDLHLIPQNNKYAKNFIKFDEMFKEIQSISALDQIFVIDACESGQAKDIVSSVYDSKASVLAKQTGVHVLLATAKGTFAFEHPNPNIKHGVFTNNILTALESKKTDENGDKKISILELSKVLRNPEFITEYQYPIIRNVGQDTKVRDF
ncbi:MAG: caspase family protein [Arcobacter sp.]|uniref:caspase family protein n=1 Tax=Arcobacter sp. TaxID=1872629 RepID=UPI002583297C|nr:caspase family protein [Arcobacter sp.]MDD3009353.1 caspase family protein [Arcobacter sp.]